jgi:hypothetical protein
MAARAGRSPKLQSGQDRSRASVGSFGQGRLPHRLSSFGHPYMHRLKLSCLDSNQRHMIGPDMLPIRGFEIMIGRVEFVFNE